MGENPVKNREDGRETRLRLLNAACDVFARKGYRDAKVAEICHHAGANVAAVNYYFGNKANLYREAWQHALTHFQDPAPLEDGSESPETMLREYIRTLMQHLTTEGGLGAFSRLYLRELVSPTGLIQDAWHDMIEPRRRRIHDILRALIDPQAEELSILLCELSIINQCRALVTIKASDLSYMLGRPLSPELIQRLAMHIADFSLAGIKAVGNAGDAI